MLQIGTQCGGDYARTIRIAFLIFPAQLHVVRKAGAWDAEDDVANSDCMQQTSSTRIIRLLLFHPCHFLTCWVKGSIHLDTYIKAWASTSDTFTLQCAHVINPGTISREIIRPSKRLLVVGRSSLLKIGAKTTQKSSWGSSESRRKCRDTCIYMISLLIHFFITSVWTRVLTTNL